MIAYCGTESTPKNSRRRFCSDRCRAAAWQATRKDRDSRLKGLVKVLAKAAGLTADDLV
jgi:hypothetical protein